MKYWIFCCFLLLNTGVFAQGDNIRFLSEGSLNIIAEPEVDALVNKYLQVNQKKGLVKGFRIQITQNVKSEPVLQAKAEILRSFSYLSVYYTYDQPDFKLRVGDFLDRFEAHKAYVALSRKFKGAFIVRDLVKGN